jgi:hypothetical protein
VSDLADATDEKKDALRKHAEKMVKDGRLKKMPSVSDGRGSTGARYRLPEGDNAVTGGLAV